MDANQALSTAAQLAAMQRQIWEAEAERQRQENRHRVQQAMFQVGMTVFCEAERMPLYAMFNPDPRAYGIARAGADAIQAAALKFIGDLSTCSRT